MNFTGYSMILPFVEQANVFNTFNFSMARYSGSTAYYGCTMEDSRFTITVTEVSRNSAGKYLPKTYSVSFWDAKTGNLKSTNTVLDEWTRVGRWDLPKRLLSIDTRDEGRRNVRQIHFSNLKLLDTGKAAAN
jgi:hypothetical protein